jgi:hypothetical protein
MVNRKIVPEPVKDAVKTVSEKIVDGIELGRKSPFPLHLPYLLSSSSTSISTSTSISVSTPSSLKRHVVLTHRYRKGSTESKGGGWHV